MSVTITHHPENGSYTHVKRSWSNTYPVERLAEWIAFYKKQRADFPKSGKHYDEDIAKLEALAKQLGLPFE